MENDEKVVVSAMKAFFECPVRNLKECQLTFVKETYDMYTYGEKKDK